MGFSRQEYWNGLPFPTPGNLPVSGIEPASPALAGGFFFFLPLSHLGTPDLLNQKLWGCGPAFCVEPSPSGDSDTR